MFFLLPPIGENAGSDTIKMPREERGSGPIRLELPNELYFALLAAFERRLGTGFELDAALYEALSLGLASIEASPPRSSLFHIMKGQFDRDEKHEFSVVVGGQVKRRLGNLENKTAVKTKKRNGIECLLQYMADEEVFAVQNRSIVVKSSLT